MQTRSQPPTKRKAADSFGPRTEWATATQLWTLAQWRAICAILFNGNTDRHEFLLCHQSDNPKQRFNKAKTARLGWLVLEAYKTIADITERPRGIGFYPWNGARHRLSYWSALDFDAHEGQSPNRARLLAGKAVALLQIENPGLAVIACTSGKSGGWHLFIFSPAPRPITNWSMFLRELAAKIGATVGTPEKGGDCELHPIETDERPRGIRAPGSLNPKDGSIGLIVFETLSARLSEWETVEGDKVITTLSPPPSRNNTTKRIATLARSFVHEQAKRYAIRSHRRRHNRLVQMVGAMFRQCANEVALKAAVLQYEQADPKPKSSLREHLADCGCALASFERNVFLKELSKAERGFYSLFKTATERTAFRILRSWSQTSQPDFYAHCETLAAQACISVQEAAKLRLQFCEAGIMRKTADCVPYQWATRYQWTANDTHQ